MTKPPRRALSIHHLIIPGIDARTRVNFPSSFSTDFLSAARNQKHAEKRNRGNDKTMKKILLIPIICVLIATTAVFGQHSQSITFSGPSQWTPGTMVNVDVFLTFSGYDAAGLAYWLEVQNPLGPYLTITNIQWLTFPSHGQPVYPILFNGGGAYAGEGFDIGGSPNNPPGFIGPGTYHINTITFSLAANAPNGSFIFRTMSTPPRISEMTDTDFNDNAIAPPGTYVINIGNAPTVQSAVSRKTHGGAGDFDVDLPLTGTAGVESRSGGGTNDYTMVLTFSGNVAVSGSPQAEVTTGTAAVGSGGVSNGGTVTVSGNTVIIPLTNVGNVQTINVRLNGVNNASDARLARNAPSSDVIIPMSVLIGDANANRVVNASDVSMTKGQVGQAVTSNNFRTDVNANGAITSTDVSMSKQNLGTGVP